MNSIAMAIKTMQKTLVLVRALYRLLIQSLRLTPNYANPKRFPALERRAYFKALRLTRSLILFQSQITR